MAIRQCVTLQLVCRRWREAAAGPPLAVRVTSVNQISQLAGAIDFPLAELEIHVGTRGVQQAVEALLAADAFRQTSGPTLRRLCGIESSAIPTRFLGPDTAHHFPALQCLDGLWGVPRKALPRGLVQLGLLDTMHYVGYGMVSIGSKLQPLQELQVLSLRGVSVDLGHLPPSLQMLLVCDCDVSGAEGCRLQQQAGLTAGKYDVYMAGDGGGGVVRLLMHFQSFRWLSLGSPATA